MTIQPANISVTAPLGLALERVKQVLFRPFDPGKWFVIGFCAWLAGLGERGGFGSNFNFTGGHVQNAADIRHQFDRVHNYVLDNWQWILPLAVFVIAIAIALGLLFLWLNSRGKFMFLHCVALNRADVVGPWNKFSAQASSLFLFRLLLGLCGLVLTLPLLIFAGASFYRMFTNDRWNAGGILTGAGAIFLVFCICVVFAIIKKLTMDFVAPIMFLRGTRTLAAWQECRGLMAGYLGEIVLYLLFQIVIGMVIGTMVVFAILITCCIAGCLLALPYLGTVLFLPVLVFKRAYSLHFLAQFGPNYDVFAPATTTPGATTQTAQGSI